MNILKFYGEEFENLTKSIVLRDKDCFISLEETLEWIKNENGFSHEGEAMNNLLRIFDPLNNRIMSGSCFQYNQIKAEFRRIHKEMYEGKENVEKEFELTYNYAEAMKIVESKKCL